MRGIILYNCSKNWGSVRKVRYLPDIYSSIKYALENVEKEFSEDLFRKYIFLGRQRRLELIHKHYQSVRYTPLGRASLTTKRLRITLPDTLTFLRNIGIFKVEKGKVHPLPLAFLLGEISNKDEANLILVKAILNCKYPAYWCFLKLLTTQGLIRIPRTFAQRNKNLRKLLWKKKILTDVASFYTLRDLFYELEIINWYIDSEGNENIYPTIAIVEREADDSEWQYSFFIRSSKILYRKRVSMDSFIDAVISSYLKLTKGRFDVEANLLSLRDDVCRELKMSDQQFRELLKKAQKYGRQVIIRLSYGSLYDKKRNYALKIVTLPEISSNRLALYIRLKKREPLD